MHFVYTAGNFFVFHPLYLIKAGVMLSRIDTNVLKKRPGACALGLIEEKDSVLRLSQITQPRIHTANMCCPKR